MRLHQPSQAQTGSDVARRAACFEFRGKILLRRVEKSGRGKLAVFVHVWSNILEEFLFLLARKLRGSNSECFGTPILLKFEDPSATRCNDVALMDNSFAGSPAPNPAHIFELEGEGSTASPAEFF